MALAAVAPWVAWAALRVTGTERGFPLVPALAFTPYAAATTPLPLALALRARSGTAAALSVAAAAVLAATLLEGRRRQVGTLAPPTGSLRVATVSLRLGLVAAEPVLDLVRRRQVDVLAVQELTPPAEQRLRAAGIADLLPHAHVLLARPGAVPSASGAVWSRHPISHRSAVAGEFEQPAARLAPPGAPDVEVVAVHAAPPVPTPRAVRTWAADLAGLPAPEPGLLRILAGDFNATPDHAAFRAVLRAGYVDAARAAGSGRAWTWRPLRLRLPRLSLDHVLVDPRIGISAVRVVAVAGSDHRAVVADLALPPSPTGG